MGNPKIPDEIKELKGTDRKHRKLENKMQAVYILSDIDAPENLTGAEVKIWHGLIPRLQKVGIFTMTDIDSVIMYCVEYARYIDCHVKLKKQGLLIEKNGNKVANPLLKISNEAIKNVMRLSIEFGMTPAARTRVAAAPKEKKSVDGMISKGFSK